MQQVNTKFISHAEQSISVTKVKQIFYLDVNYAPEGCNDNLQTKYEEFKKYPKIFTSS